MAVESAADRAAFLSPDDFGATATYRTAAGPETSLALIFDHPTGTRFSDPGMLAEGPRCRLRTADLPDGARDGQNTGDRIIVDGVAYLPLGFTHDGTGMTVVKLRKTIES